MSWWLNCIAFVDLCNLFRVNPLVSTTILNENNIRETGRPAKGFSKNKTLPDNYYDIKYEYTTNRETIEFKLLYFCQ